jgi:hypothetical protein
LSHAPQQQAPAPPSTWTDYLAAQPQSLLWAFEFCESWSNMEGILDALRSGTLIGVSDGSFCEGMGTAAWTLEASIGTSITGGCVVPGLAHVHSSMRSELAGLYAMLGLLSLIADYFDIKDGAITLACDGKNALGEIFDTNKSFRFGRAHNDLILASRRFLDKLPFQVLWQQVQGHQLDNPFVEYKDLDRLSQLNEDMDILAKTILSQVEHTVRPIQHKVFGEPWTIWHRSEKLCHDIPQRLHDIIDGPACLSYWARHDKFGNASHHDVDWDSTREFMSTIDPKRARWLTKHTSGHCPVGTVMKKRKERITDECQHCSQSLKHPLMCGHAPTHQFNRSGKLPFVL